MTLFKFSFLLAALGLATSVSAQLNATAQLNTTVQTTVIGPVAELDIINAEVSLDGFSRQAVLAGGTFPGPIIKGNKV